MLGAINDHIDMVADFVGGQVVFHANGASLSEALPEKLPGVSALSDGVSHS